jgi:hypothetical protein
MGVVLGVLVLLAIGRLLSAAVVDDPPWWSRQELHEVEVPTSHDHVDQISCAYFGVSAVW